MSAPAPSAMGNNKAFDTMKLSGQPESAHLEHTHSLAYRPDIDGLRALAVGLVVLYHFFPNQLPGGFVGVDVFFVISGFLISSIILAQLRRRTWSYSSFYTRRINRIFPALALVLVANLALGWFALVPGEIQSLGKHVAASAGFVVNFALWGEAGYFDQAALTKPLLHMWSLAIEEQFYIAWPMLLGLTALRRHGMAIVALLVFGSLAYSTYLSVESPTAAYYSPLSRFFELGIGGLLAWVSLDRPGKPGRLAAHALSIGGLLLIMLGAVIITTRDPFPGLWALAPALGTAAVIAAGPRGLLNAHLLALRPVVLGGLLSYSLYLWHWPVLVWAKMITLSDAISVPSRLALIGLAVALASATYFLVELPMARLRSSARSAIAMAAIVAIVGAAGLLFWSGAVHSRHNSPDLEPVTAAVNDWGYPSRGLEVERRFSDYTFYRKAGLTEQTALFIGDSNVEQYAPRVEWLIDSGRTPMSAIFATKGGCPFAVPVLAREKRDCAGKLDHIAELVARDDVKVVIIGQQWLALTQLIDDPAAEASFREFLKRIPDGKRVFVMLNMPTGAGFGPADQLEGSRLGTLEYKGSQLRDGAAARRRLAPINSRIREIAESEGAQVIDPFSALCSGDTCPVADAKGRPAYKDGQHLSASFARARATFIDQVLLAE